MNNQGPNTVILMPTKSMGAGILLALFFGPLGLFYSSVWGGLIMLVLGGVLAVVGGVLTGGLGLIPILFLIGVVSVIWAAIAVNGHNKKILSAQNIGGPK